MRYRTLRVVTLTAGLLTVTFGGFTHFFGPAPVLAAAASEYQMVSPASTNADQITLNVPVRLDNLSPEVKKGAITCMVTLNWVVGGAGMPTVTNSSTGRAEFSISAGTGSAPFTGNIAVQVQTGPPKQAVDYGYPITFQAGNYACGLLLASDTGDFYGYDNFNQDTKGNLAPVPSRPSTAWPLWAQPAPGTGEQYMYVQGTISPYSAH